MLNRKQALELFEREAVYFCNADVVPIFRVRQLFGEKAVNFAVRSSESNGENGVFFLLSDFLEAVNYVNYKECKMMEQNETVVLFPYFKTET